MSIKSLIVIAILGILAGIISAVVYNEKIVSQPPVAVSYNPYEAGIYATGIIESLQNNGSNINIFPEVAGRVTEIFLRDGEVVEKGTPILAIDDSVQREIVAKDAAQIEYSTASLISVQKQLEKTQSSYSANPRSVSLNALDNAIYAVKIAEGSLNVSEAQYRADKALLDKYVIRAPSDGMILRIASAIGDYASPQGSYDPNTQGMLPTVQVGIVAQYLQVRTFVDEILVPNLPDPSKLEATLFVRGLNNRSIPLEFDSLQPYTIPNIQLSNERQERVDVRVLPIIFRFKRPTDINIFPGQLVDVFIKGKA